MNTLAKAALITGASARIGKAIALGLAQAGYAVAIHHHSSSDEASALAEEIEAGGGRAFALAADLAVDSESRALFAAASSAIGPIGLLVNNASIFESDMAGDSNAMHWNDHFQIHVRAPAVLTRALYESLSEDQAGLVVNMIDQRVLKPNPDFHSYTLSKAALWTATKTMAQEFAPRLRVNAIGPGPTLPSPRQTAQQFERQVAALPLQTAPDLESFSRTLLYFADTPSVTGQMIALDGGQHLAWETADLKVPE